MNEKPPSTYREAKKIAEDVCTNYNGRGSELCRKTDVYGALREVRIVNLDHLTNN